MVIIMSLPIIFWITRCLNFKKTTKSLKKQFLLHNSNIGDHWSYKLKTSLKILIGDRSNYGENQFQRNVWSKGFNLEKPFFFHLLRDISNGNGKEMKKKIESMLWGFALDPSSIKCMHQCTVVQKDEKTYFAIFYSLPCIPYSLG